MTARPLHRDDARALLERWRLGFEEARDEYEDYQGELTEVISQCLDAHLSKTEIAEIAGLSRTTIHRYAKEPVT